MGKSIAVLGVAARQMRRILMDHARSRHILKRDGNRQKISLEKATTVSYEQSTDLLAVHEALKKLETLNERMGRIVELRFFGGLSVEEAAEVLKVSPATVKRNWTFAKAFMHEAISNES